MSDEKYALLQTFRALFEAKPYLHRKSNLGDLVASQLYEDLVTLDKSTKLAERVHQHERVVNQKNLMTGKPSRRGDGTFGELIPAAVALTEKGMLVARGPVATIEIGAETKILAKAMIKQIDRVITLPIKPPNLSSAAATRSVSLSSELTSPSDMSPSKAANAGQPMAKNTNIQFRRRLKPNNASKKKPVRLSMNFRSLAFARPMHVPFPLNGSTWEKQKWNTHLS